MSDQAHAPGALSSRHRGERCEMESCELTKVYLLYTRTLYKDRGVMMAALPTALRAHAMTFLPSGTQSRGSGLVSQYCTLAHGGKLEARQDNFGKGVMAAPLCTRANLLLYAGVEPELKPLCS